MSMENAHKFYAKARKDAAIWARIEQAIASGKSDMEVSETIAEIGKSTGFNFTAAEALAFRDTKAKEQARKMPQVMAKAWADKQFKERLLSNTTKVLEEEGVDVPPGIEMRVVADSEKVRHIVLPMPPKSAELSVEQLAAVAGGGNLTPVPIISGPAPIIQTCLVSGGGSGSGSGGGGSTGACVCSSY